VRKSPKERRNQYVQAQRITTAESAIAVKAPPAMTFSATHPAYTYTSLCSDSGLREPPGPRQEHPQGILPIRLEKICLICRKHWPSDCRRDNCDCERQGHLFSMGNYYQPKAGGGVGSV
jgi:hypothetical protein